jgi:16S rRNA (uracil1498-N3)-methyltransferase
LHPARPLLEIARTAPASSHRLVLWERASVPLHALDLAHGGGDAARELWAIIGPEGGLSETEVEALRALGFMVAGLGSAILRVETAAPVISALLLARLGRLS